MKHHIIGGGGVGSILIQMLVRILGQDEIVVHDGDTLEERNLDRQIFRPDQIGQKKANALRDLYSQQSIGGSFTSITSRPEYYYAGCVEHQPDDILWCCVDNNAGRNSVCESADRFGCWAFFGANEYTDAEGYCYMPSWRGTPLDPRVRYPAIMTDQSDDPMRPAGCTGLAAQASPQLVLANAWAANFMLHLYWHWFRDGPHKAYELQHSPVHHRVSTWTFTTTKKG